MLQRFEKNIRGYVVTCFEKPKLFGMCWSCPWGACGPVPAALAPDLRPRPRRSPWWPSASRLRRSPPAFGWPAAPCLRHSLLAFGRACGTCPRGPWPRRVMHIPELLLRIHFDSNCFASRHQATIRAAGDVRAFGVSVPRDSEALALARVMARGPEAPRSRTGSAQVPVRKRCCWKMPPGWWAGFGNVRCRWRCNGCLRRRCCYRPRHVGVHGCRRCFIIYDTSDEDVEPDWRQDPAPEEEQQVELQ